jgi:phosphoglycolate phosphatase-like HAD superfamily hydrolase
MKRVVVFDLDGTLIDSKKLYTDTIHHSLLEHYFNVRNAHISEHPKNAEHFFGFPKSRVSRALGPKLEITLRNIGRFQPEILQELKNSINKDVAHEAAYVKLCPYAKGALKKLKKRKYTLILLTNSAGEFSTNVLKAHKIRKYFSKLFYAESFSSKEDAIRAIAKKYKVQVSEIIYIADKKADVKIARNAGCRIIITLACSWDKKLFNREKYTISSLKQLEAALSK